MASPGVSTRYSMDSSTPERTGPCGIVNSRSPPRAGAAGFRGRADQRGSRGWPCGHQAELVVDHALVPERGAQPEGERRIAVGAGRQRRLQRVDAARRRHVRGQRDGAVGAGWSRTGRRTGRPRRPGLRASSHSASVTSGSDHRHRHRSRQLGHGAGDQVGELAGRMHAEDEQDRDAGHHRDDHPGTGLAARQRGGPRRGLRGRGKQHPGGRGGQAEEHHGDQHDQHRRGRVVARTQAAVDDLELAAEDARRRHRRQREDGEQEQRAAPRQHVAAPPRILEICLVPYFTVNTPAPMNALPLAAACASTCSRTPASATGAPKLTPMARMPMCSTLE